jgi:hypothetical protein
MLPVVRRSRPRPVSNFLWFYVKEKGQFHGRVRLDVADDSGLPVRLELADPGSPGRMTMDYYDFDQPAEIEVPPCM